MIYYSRFLRIMDPFLSGPDVLNVQQRLTELGYYNGPTDSIYDYEVVDAVKAFQQENQLMADGVVGPDTWNAIGLSREAQEITTAPYSITVDIEKKEMAVYENGVGIATFPVAVGKPTTPTPLGDWKIIQKTLNPGGPFGVRWMRLNIEWGGLSLEQQRVQV
ncbi:MAG: L,D-transpeptidase family protein [Mahellales bacterium]